MPFIHTKTSCPISREQEAQLAKEMGKAVTLLHKSQQWLMLQFEDNCRMYFRGQTDAPLAFVNVKLYGAADDAAYQAMTEEITGMLQKVLGISADHIYVEYDETPHWGWNGSNF